MQCWINGPASGGTDDKIKAANTSQYEKNLFGMSFASLN